MARLTALDGALVRLSGYLWYTYEKQLRWLMNPAEASHPLLFAVRPTTSTSSAERSWRTRRKRRFSWRCSYVTASLWCMWHTWIVEVLHADCKPTFQKHLVQIGMDHDGCTPQFIVFEFQLIARLISKRGNANPTQISVLDPKLGPGLGQ